MDSENIFEKIVNEVDIVKIISEYVSLEKKSSSYIGLCPFHPDTNPSMHVSPTKKIYKCFSCNAGGDVINFVANYNKVSNIEAVKIIAKSAGIDIDIKSSSYEEINAKYLDVLKSSVSFYQFVLNNTTQGKIAKTYLANRGLNEEILKKFNIGLSLDEPDFLYKSLISEEHLALDILEAGLIRGKDTYTDFFRNRIMFPLDDIYGNIVGFSGRLYDDSNGPKYVNSIESRIFKKGQILFNFSNAINTIRQSDRVIIFEGFLDVFAAYKVGINDAVAIMGTSLSQHQITAIKKYTNNITICFDGDTPGINATKKAIYQLLAADVNISVAKLTDGLDPDDYLEKYGSEKFKDLLTNSLVSGYDFLYESELINLDKTNLNSVEAFQENIYNHLDRIKSNLITEAFLQRLSKDLKISYESLSNDYNKREKVQTTYPVYDILDFPLTEEAYSEVKHIKHKYAVASKVLIRAAFNSKKNCRKINERLQDYYMEIEHNFILQSLISFYNTNEEINERFFSELTEESKLVLANILEDKRPLFSIVDITDEAIDDHIDQVLSYKHELASIEAKNEGLSARSTSDVIASTKKLIQAKKKNIKIINKEK